jgi:phosphatidylglycerophosphatase C
VDVLDQPREPAPLLVFFDLDGTITRRDTLSGYLLGFALRHPVRLLRFLTALPALVRFVIDRDRGRLKGALISSLMGGLARQTIDEWSRGYVASLLRRGVFSEARAAIDRHRSAGDHLVLMSATVDLYVPAIADALGFSEHICTPVRWHEDGTLDGALAAANVRDHEKARQLKRVALRHSGKRLVGYANSMPDLEHLRLVDRAVLINPDERLRRAAGKLPVEFKYWS